MFEINKKLREEFELFEEIKKIIDNKEIDVVFNVCWNLLKLTLEQIEDEHRQELYKLIKENIETPLAKI